MVTVALIPVKPFGRAKSRLAAVASPHERMRLAQAMLEDVLLAVANARSPLRVTVVGSEAAAAGIAARFGCAYRHDARGDLNAQLERARHAARAGSDDRLLCLPADVPCIAPDDIDDLIAGAACGAALCISPIDGGTNALCTQAGRAVPYAYGVDSGRRHAYACEAAGLAVQSMHLPRLRDIDTPDDLAWLLAAGAHTRAGQVLRSRGLARLPRVA